MAKKIAFEYVFPEHKDRLTGEPVAEKVVLVRELGVSEFHNVMEMGGRSQTETANNFGISLEGLRQSIVKIGKRDMTAQDMIGDQMNDFFRFHEVVSLCAFWNRIHLPDKEVGDSESGNLTAVEYGA